MNGQQSGLPCINPDCGSSDALTIYPKGDAYCFSCEKHFFKDQLSDLVESTESDDRPNPPSPTGKAANVPSRGLQEASLAYYGVTVRVDPTSGEVNGLDIPVYSKGEVTGHKYKQFEPKEFGGTGSLKNPDFFGQAQAGSGGKLLIVTEGEEDCMSARQMLMSQGKNYNVVSLPSGANIRAVKDHINWLESYETVTLNLDNDDVGKECAKKIAELLTPGKVKIMTLPVKDANDYLLSGKKDYLKQLWNAQVYRPDGVVSMSNIREYLKKGELSGPSIPYPWKGLNDKLYGMREREIVTWTAGTGIGKSAVIREIEHHLLRTTKDTVGVLALEESVDRTGWGVIAVEANLPLAIREERFKLGYKWDSPEVDGWIKSSGMEDRMHVLDHWGSTGVDNLISKVRFMIKALDCRWIILDHLSIVVSAMDSGEDERKTIDRIMTTLRGLTEETGAGLQLVSHLRRIDGNRGHEQGMEIGLSHLRGSQAIAQLSDAVVAMERNQQADDEKEANLTRIRVLKNRYAGITGLATNLAYDRKTGRLQEIFNVDTYLAPSAEEAGC